MCSCDYVSTKESVAKNLILTSEIGSYYTTTQSELGFSQSFDNNWEVLVCVRRVLRDREYCYPLCGQPAIHDNYIHLALKEEHCIPLLTKLAKGGVVFHPYDFSSDLFPDTFRGCGRMVGNQS